MFCLCQGFGSGDVRAGNLNQLDYTVYVCELWNQIFFTEQLTEWRALTREETLTHAQITR